MTSRSEIPVRRLAVFGGFGHPEPGPSWSATAYRDAKARRGGTDVTRRPDLTRRPDVTRRPDEAGVLRFEAPARTPDLQHAA